MKHAVRLGSGVVFGVCFWQETETFLSRLKISKQPANLALFSVEGFSFALRQKDDILSLCRPTSFKQLLYLAKAPTNLSSWLLHLLCGVGLHQT